MNDREFGIEKQKLLIEYMLENSEIFLRTANILETTYFEKDFQAPVKFILEYSNEFKALPTLKQIYAETGVTFEPVVNVKEQDTNWALESIEQFCKRQAIVNAVWESTDHIEKGDYGQVMAMVKAAMEISLQKDLGTTYHDDPKARLERMRLNTLIPTGWQDIDSKLYGGINRGEITIFAGASGAGKSLFLQNIALNWIEGVKYEYSGQTTEHDPLNVVYISMELSEELISKRIDTMVTGVDARDIFKRIDEVTLKVVMHGKKTGDLVVKYMPQGTTTNDIRSYLKEYEIQTNKKVDALCVDYLDLMFPASVKINPGDLFVKDKYVTEELRSLAAELDILCCTASQLNRSAIDESEHSQAMIAGGISKINTADNVLTIYSSPGMRDRGEYMAQFLKTRSSSGVGQKVPLSFDVTTMRIGNADAAYAEQTESLRVTAGNESTGNSLLDQIKRQSPPKTSPITVTKDEVTDAEVVIDNTTGEILSETENPEPQNLTERLQNLRKEGKLA